MARRIGRNDPCHCGSGLKLKRCHIVARKIPPVKSMAEESDVDKLFREKYDEIVQDSRHFPSDLVPFIVKKRMLEWLKNLMKGKENEFN